MNLDQLLDALTKAAETGHGYLPARRAVTEHVAEIAADFETERRKVAHYTKLTNDLARDLADRNRTIAAYRERIGALIESDDLPDGESLK